MTDKIRVGIVGATVTQGGSGWGANAHVPALKALPGYELSAVCTSHEDTAKASVAAFGARRGFHRFSDMAASPDVDLIVVCVRVPGHKELVMAGLQAGKAMFCEWPLGATLAEAQEMAGLARQRSLKSIVGLQARSDPAVLYARDLIKSGHIGEVLTAHLNASAPAVLQRGPGRIWQGVRANGANTLTIAGGHAIDAMCAILGEFAEVSARVTTRIPEWRDLTGKPVAVDAPDSINVIGRMASGATDWRSMAAKGRWSSTVTARSTSARARCTAPRARRPWPRCPSRPSTGSFRRARRPARPTTWRKPTRAPRRPCGEADRSTSTSTSPCSATR
jgi:predicted dehydrogenase